MLAHGRELRRALHGGVGPAFGIDGLSAFYLVVVAATAVPTLVYARDSLADAAGLSVAHGAVRRFLLSLAGVLAARDVTTFRAFWALMTLVPGDGDPDRASRSCGPPHDYASCSPFHVQIARVAAAQAASVASPDGKPQ